MPSASYTLTRGGKDIELDIEYEVARLIPGNTYGLPEDCYPDEGGECEELTAYRDGKPFALTKAEHNKIAEHVELTHDHSDYAYED